MWVRTDNVMMVRKAQVVAAFALLVSCSNAPVTPRTSPCQPGGQSCQADTDCCALGTCMGGACSTNSCLASGSACNETPECCSPLLCTSEVCTAYVPCHGAGGSCSVDTDCCYGGTCVGGTCSGASCFPPGDECDNASQCCNAGGCTAATFFVPVPCSRPGSVVQLHEPRFMRQHLVLASGARLQRGHSVLRGPHLFLGYVPLSGDSGRRVHGEHRLLRRTAVRRRYLRVPRHRSAVCDVRRLLQRRGVYGWHVRGWVVLRRWAGLPGRDRMLQRASMQCRTMPLRSADARTRAARLTRLRQRRFEVRRPRKDHRCRN